MTFAFQTQLAKGQDAEKVLDRHFTAKFKIQEATDAEQRRGIVPLAEFERHAEFVLTIGEAA